MNPRCTPGSSVNPSGDGWHLTIPKGAQGIYRLAQLDDYAMLSRRQFRHSNPLTLGLRARVSETNLPGTWGFGLWNDPFGFSLGFGGTPGRLPILPNAAWFFYASPQNWLALRDGIPANGFFAGTFHSPRISSMLLAPALPVVPFMVFRSISRLVRKLASPLSRQDGAALPIDVTAWHKYSIEWLCEKIEFWVDGSSVLKTSISPLPPLGLVFWIDNQFAAWTPQGRLDYGTLGNPAEWLEIDSFELIG